MGKKVMYEFDYMHYNDIVAHITVYMDFTVGVERFTEIDSYMPVPVPATYDDVELLYTTMCFDEGHPDKQEILNSFGVEFYDPFSIVKVTNGYMWDDPFWIRFEGDTITYEELVDKWE